MAIYLKYDGIDGDATHEDHDKWITVESMQWGVGRAISTPVGSVLNREASEPSVAEVTVTTQMNTSSVYMFQEACTGQTGKEVKIHLVSTGSPGQTYVEYTLTDTLVSGYSVSSGGDRPSESLTLNFTKVEMKYIPLQANNEAGSPITKGYDLKTTKAV